MGLSALRKTQAGFDAAVLRDTSEQVFDATACYFPVTFTPPPNDPHNISPDTLRTGALSVVVCVVCACVCWVLGIHGAIRWASARFLLASLASRVLAAYLRLDGTNGPCACGS